MSVMLCAKYRQNEAETARVWNKIHASVSNFFQNLRKFISSAKHLNTAINAVFEPVLHSRPDSMQEINGG